MRELQFVMEKASRGYVPYTWGGSSEDLSKGIDCSGYMFRAGRNIGLPVRRTTSRRMANMEGGWIGIRVDLNDLRRSDLVFWTFKKGRPNGHVGAVFPEKGKVTHSSPSRNRPVIDAMKGILITAATETLRLKLEEALK